MTAKPMPCATTSSSRTDAANASGCSAAATARTRPPAICAGTSTACSHDRPRGTAYAELQVTTHFSFLRGASSVEELFAEAAIARDRRARRSPTVIRWPASSGRTRRPRSPACALIVGCRLDLTDGAALLVYPTDRAAYGRLCRLLTLGKGRAGKGELLRCAWDDVVAHGEGLIAILVPDRPDAVCAEQLRRLAREFRDRAYLALSLRRRPGDQLRLHELSNMAAAMRVATVVDQRRAVPQSRAPHAAGCRHLHPRRLHDRRCRLPARAPRRPPSEAARGNGAAVRALSRGGGAHARDRRTRCRFSLDELAYQYPDETSEPGLTAQQTLTG